MIVWVNSPGRIFWIFDWIIFARFMGKKLAKMANLRTWTKFSQNLSDNFFSNRTKWRLIMTSFCSRNAILIESPEGGQIGQKQWAKFRQSFKLYQISQKLCDEFSSYRTKWRLIMTACSSQNAILIESPEGGQIGQKWAKFRPFYKLCQISPKLSDEFSSYCTKWRLIMTACSSQNAILIESPESGQIGQKWAKFRQFYKLCLIPQKLSDVFFLIAPNEGSS